MISIVDYYPLLTEKKIPLKLLDVSSRVYFNWKKEGLIYEQNVQPKEDQNILQIDSKRKKVFLSVYDALWILIIKELRKLNIDLQTILELKKFLFTIVQLNQEKLSAVSKENFVQSIIEKFPEELHEVVLQKLNENTFKELFENTIDEETAIAFTYVANLLFNILVFKKAVSVVIIKENASTELDFFIAQNNNNATIEEKEELYQLYSTHFSKDTLINIPILPLVQTLFEDENLEKYCIEFGLFNTNEKKLLKALKDDNCKKITVIKYDSENITFDITRERNIKGAEAKEIRKILGLKQYEKVEVTFRNDKHLIIKNTQRENNVIY